MDENIKKTVLVVDDEKSIREIVKIHLENQGYNVITSENGEGAIDLLMENNIALTITDIKMPKLDGWGLLDYIKTHCSHVPVIVLTGYIDVETAVASMKKGAVDYVPKPIKRDEFIDVVKNALSRKEPKEKLESFEISDVYLLDEGGVVIFHKHVTLDLKLDEDMFGSMFTAIKAFIKDSLHSDEDLRYIEHGSLKILVEEGKDFFLVVVGKGDVVKPVKENMKKIASKIYEDYGATISNWKGNMGMFKGIEEEFGDLIEKFRNKGDK